MLVFGDRVRERETREVFDEVRRYVERGDRLGAFVTASELAVGLVDAVEALDAPAMAMLTEIATGAPGLIALARLEAIAHPDVIRTKRAEGYAFYALYPELYLRAARHAPRSDIVIGLRSIGAGLAAVVALGSGGVPRSVRPFGDPYRRRVTLDVIDPRARYAVVDEGPGLSGSSFGAVLDTLEDAGVPLDHITCFPSHRNDLGPVASDRHRARWTRTRRHVVEFEALLPRISAGIAELVGPLIAPLQDISGGAWRSLHYGDEREWPPVIAYQERRKYLAHTHTGSFLARFVGLGRDADAALARARDLRDFTPHPVGLVDGFLVERWLDRARPLPRAQISREVLVHRVGHYLACRATRVSHSGATLHELAAMVRRNASMSLDGDLTALERRRRPVEVDGRMHAWEWLVTDEGALVKTDAYDHYSGHDLVGCQDITWDIAGAEIELALTSAELERVIAIVGSVDRDLLRVARTSYLAFQLGRAALAAESATPNEARRLRDAAAAYAAHLRR